MLIDAHLALASSGKLMLVLCYSFGCYVEKSHLKENSEVGAMPAGDDLCDSGFPHVCFLDHQQGHVSYSCSIWQHLLLHDGRVSEYTASPSSSRKAD